MVRIALLDALFIAKGYRALSTNIDDRWNDL
jgi:chorismate synthase